MFHPVFGPFLAMSQLLSHHCPFLTLANDCLVHCCVSVTDKMVNHVNKALQKQLENLPTLI